MLFDTVYNKMISRRHRYNRHVKDRVFTKRVFCLFPKYMEDAKRYAWLHLVWRQLRDNYENETFMEYVLDRLFSINTTYNYTLEDPGYDMYSNEIKWLLEKYGIEDELVC